MLHLRLVCMGPFLFSSQSGGSEFVAIRSLFSIMAFVCGQNERYVLDSISEISIKDAILKHSCCLVSSHLRELTVRFIWFQVQDLGLGFALGGVLVSFLYITNFILGYVQFSWSMLLATNPRIPGKSL